MSAVPTLLPVVAHGHPEPARVPQPRRGERLQPPVAHHLTVDAGDQDVSAFGDLAEPPATFFGGRQLQGTLYRAGRS